MAAHRHLRPGHRRSTQHGPQHLQLREADALVAAEQAGPGATGQHHGVAGDAPAFRDDAGHPARLQVQAAGGAALQDGGAQAAGGGGHGGDGVLRLGLAVRGGVKRAVEAAAGGGQQGRRLVGVQQAGADLVVAGALQPGGVAFQLARGFRDIGDAGPAEAHVGADAGGHAVP